MNFPDRWLCLLFGHGWDRVNGVGGPWRFCRRCGETSESPAGGSPIGMTRGEK